MAITKEQIIEAAESLQAAGTNPSMQAIRTALGGGSFATISPVLREWKDSKTQKSIIAIEMPGEAKTALDRAGIELWKIITGLATERLIKVREDADEAINNANAERDEAFAEIESLEKRLELAEKSLTEAINTEDKLASSLNDARNEIRELEINVADKARVEEENERLRAELAQLRSENKLLVDAKIDLKGQLADMSSRAAGMENDLSTTQKSAAALSEKLSEKDVTINKLQAQINSADLNIQKLQISLDHAAKTHDDLKKEVSETRKIIGDREREAGALSGELKAIKAENMELKTKRDTSKQAGK